MINKAWRQELLQKISEKKESLEVIEKEDQLNENTNVPKVGRVQVPQKTDVFDFSKIDDTKSNSRMNYPSTDAKSRGFIESKLAL